jgi:hypothetical protein
LNNSKENYSAAGVSSGIAGSASGVAIGASGAAIGVSGAVSSGTTGSIPSDITLKLKIIFYNSL